MVEKPTAGQALAFLFLPIEKSDFLRLSDQLSILWRFFSATYKSFGLLPDGYESRGFLADLNRASATWWGQWGDVIYDALEAGNGRTFSERMRLLGRAFLSEKNIVRDTAAIGYGWSSFLAFWFIIIYLVLHYLVGAAHAAGTSTDLARQAMGTIFPFWGGATALAQALGQVAAILSKMSLALAGIGAIWTIIVMAIEAGASWENAKQRYSIIMFGLRVGLALGLLAPLPTGTGFNAGQGLVANIGIWGSDQATIAATAMIANLATPSSGTSNSLVAPPMISELEIEQTVAAVAKAEACMSGINMDETRNQNESVQPVPATNSTGNSIVRYDHFVKNFLNMNSPDVEGGCGIVTFVDPTTTGTNSVGSSAVGAVAAAQTTAFNALQKTIHADIQTIIQNHINCRNSGDDASCGADPDPGQTVAGWVNTYRQAVAQNVTSAVSSANQSAAQQLTTGSTDQGWISVGAYAITLTQLQSSLDGAAGALPRVSSPRLNNVGQLEEIADNFVSNGMASGGTPIGSAEQAINTGNPHAGDDLFRAIISGGTLAMMPQINSMSPLTGMSTLGRYTYEAAGTMKVAFEAFSGIIGANSGDDDAGGSASKSGLMSKVIGFAKKSGVVAVGSAALEGVKSTLTPLFFLGVALAYFVPSLPFIRFFFAVVLWMIAFVETVILINCGLVLMINPEHGGLFGSAAKACLWNVVALAVRPLLTVIGFVAGLQVLSAAIGILNTLMLPMMTANEKTSSSTGNWTIVGFMAYLAIYLGIAYVTTNTCTKLAEMLPNAAYRWLGANGAGERDDASAIAGVLGGLAARLHRGGPSRAR